MHVIFHVLFIKLAVLRKECKGKLDMQTFSCSAFVRSAFIFCSLHRINNYYHKRSALVTLFNKGLKLVTKKN